MHLILDKREFGLGVLLLVLFAIPLILLFTPVFNGKTGLKASDALFNSLAKDSSYYIPQAQVEADKMKGEELDMAVTPKKAETQDLMATLLEGANAQVSVDGRQLRVQGDLGELMNAATVDADNLFKQQEADIKARYGADNAKLVLYVWHDFFSQAENTYKRENMADRALSIHTLLYRGIEPAYNFAGIEAAPILERVGITVFLLAFYVIYTIWFGFSILFVFEGLGIRAQAH